MAPQPWAALKKASLHGSNNSPRSNFVAPQAFLVRRWNLNCQTYEVPSTSCPYQANGESSNKCLGRAGTKHLVTHFCETNIPCAQPGITGSRQGQRQLLEPHPWPELVYGIRHNKICFLRPENKRMAMEN